MNIHDKPEPKTQKQKLEELLETVGALAKLIKVLQKHGKFVSQIHKHKAPNFKSSDYLGVAKYGANRWKVSFRILSVQLEVGTFTQEKTAALAYDAVVKELFGDKALLNFPKEEQHK